MRSAFRLTRNFPLGEWCVSRTRPDLVEDVPDHLGPNVVRHTFTLLQPIRDRYGPIYITSGYRPPRLNNALGGSPTSQHLLGEAADVVGMDSRRTKHIFYDLVEGVVEIPAGQVIWYPDRHFLHIALPSDRYPSFIPCVHWPKRGYLYRPVDHASLQEVPEL